MDKTIGRILGEAKKPPTEAQLTDPREAYRYALFVLKGRWPEGEPVIATSPHDAYLYACYVLKGRWPEGEPVIATRPGPAFLYAKYVLKGRFPEGEAAITNNTGWTYEYARDVLKGRFPEAEAAIATDPQFAYLYARDVLKGRFPEAEAAIATDPRYNELYTQDVINGRPDTSEKARRASEQRAVDDLPVLSHSQDESFKYYVWYLSDGAAYPLGFSILLLFSGSQQGQLMRAVLRGDPLSTDLDFDFLNFEGKITEDDDAYSKPIVHSIIQRSQTDRDWTDVEKGSTLYYTLVKAVQTVYTVDEYDGWPLGLSNPGKIKELTPSLAKRLLSLVDL